MDTVTRLSAFVAVADAGGFSAAARARGQSKALMSKYVAELEDELGARLFNRNTRKLSLTEAGITTYDEAQVVLKRLERLRETIEAANDTPRGRLRVSVARIVGEGHLAPAIMGFLRSHPQVRMELSLEDRFVNLVEDGYDLAIRVAKLEDSTLIARKLADFRTTVHASPAVIARYGTPTHPRDLGSLPCVIDTNVRSPNTWSFVENGETFPVAVSGRLSVNGPDAAAEAARAGLGFSRGPWIAVRDDLNSGDLVQVLEEYVPNELGIHAVYPHRKHLPAKVRAFIDFVAAWYETERKAGRFC